MKYDSWKQFVEGLDSKEIAQEINQILGLMDPIESKHIDTIKKRVGALAPLKPGESAKRLSLSERKSERFHLFISTDSEGNYRIFVEVKNHLMKMGAGKEGTVGCLLGEKLGRIFILTQSNHTDSGFMYSSSLADGVASLKKEAKIFQDLNARDPELFPVVVLSETYKLSEDVEKAALIMPMAEGGTMLEFWSSSTPIKVLFWDAVLSCERLVKQLDLLHKTGYVHGDLELRNMLLMHPGRCPLLIDFDQTTKHDAKQVGDAAIERGKLFVGLKMYLDRCHQDNPYRGNEERMWQELMGCLNCDYSSIPDSSRIINKIQDFLFDFCKEFMETVTNSMGFLGKNSQKHQSLQIYCREMKEEKSDRPDRMKIILIKFIRAAIDVKRYSGCSNKTASGEACRRLLNSEYYLPVRHLLFSEKSHISYQDLLDLPLPMNKAYSLFEAKKESNGRKAASSQDYIRLEP